MTDTKKIEAESFEFVLKGMLEALSGEHEKSVKDKFEALTKEQQDMLSNQDNAYWLQSATEEFTCLVAHAWKLPSSNSFSIAIVDGSLKDFFSQYMSRVEGSSCSVDKSRFICSRIAQSLQKNENVSLFDDYSRSERIALEERSNQAYWSPRTIKDTDEAKKIYWDWRMLKHLAQ